MLTIETASFIKRILVTIIIMAGATISCALLSLLSAPLSGFLLVLQLALIIVALMFDRICGLLAAVIGALSFNFLFTEPHYSLVMDEAEDISNLAIFVITSLLASQLAQIYRKQQMALRRAQLQNSLLMSVSHDLRTPLATIMGSLDTLKHFGTKLPSPEHSELVEGALSESRRLHHYIENLLQASRLYHDGKAQQRDMVDADALIDTVISQFQTNRLTVSSSLKKMKTVQCFAPVLEQALYNIIDNALRYSPESQTVEIALENNSEHVKISVRDYGKNVPSQRIQERFEPFVTSRNKDSGEGGLGLGLTVARAIIEAHQGTIVMTSANPGCVVKITLPSSVKEAV